MYSLFEKNLGLYKVYKAFAVYGCSNFIKNCNKLRYLITSLTLRNQT